MQSHFRTRLISCRWCFRYSFQNITPSPRHSCKIFLSSNLSLEKPLRYLRLVGAIDCRNSRSITASFSYLARPIRAVRQIPVRSTLPLLRPKYIIAISYELCTRYKSKPFVAHFQRDIAGRASKAGGTTIGGRRSCSSTVDTPRRDFETGTRQRRTAHEMAMAVETAVSEVLA